MANFTNTVLYVGVTNDLMKRVWQHKNKFYPDSFTSRYQVNKLLYYENFGSAYQAITREKQIKAGSRIKKELLINQINVRWRDLSESFFFQ